MPDKSVILQAKYSLILEYPFFGRLIMELRVIEKDKIISHSGGETYACTDGQVLFLSTTMCKKLDEAQKLGLLCHEILHCALGHIWRRNNKDPLLFNIACDLIINQIVLENSMKLPKGGLEPREKYKDWSAEAIYVDLKMSQKKIDKFKNSGMEDMVPGSFGDPDGSQQDQGQGQCDPNDEEGQGECPGCPNCQGEGQGNQSTGNIYQDGGVLDTREIKYKPLSDSQQKEMKAKWKGALQDATVKVKGNTPAGMDIYIEDLLDPALPWQVLLANITSRIDQDDYDMARADRRLLPYDVYLPDLYSEGIDVVCAVDMSGSIGQEEASSFLAEIRGILSNHTVKSLRIMACDCEITFDETLESDDPLPTSLGGGGGTSFVPIFEKLEEAEEVPSILVYFTDGYGDFPKYEPDYPVVWVTQETGWGGPLNPEQFPWGDVIEKTREDLV